MDPKNRACIPLTCSTKSTKIKTQDKMNNSTKYVLEIPYKYIGDDTAFPHVVSFLKARLKSSLKNV